MCCEVLRSDAEWQVSNTDSGKWRIGNVRRGEGEVVRGRRGGVEG